MSKDDAIPHIIFYGPEGSGKKTIIRLFLEMLFDRIVHRNKDVSFMVSGSGNHTQCEKVKQSNYHIVIDPKNNNFDRYLIQDIVKEYAKRRSLGIFKTKKAFKVVRINNLDNMSYYAQTSLRRTMERYNDKCRFIMWCKSLSKVIEPLQSRCICLRIAAPSDAELFQYIFKISVMEGMKLTMQEYAKIIEKSNGNIKRGLWELDFYRFKYTLDTNYFESINNIIKLVIKPSLSNMAEIRNIIFNLMITNFEATTIMTDLLDTACMSDKISDESKQKIVCAGATIENQLVKGRRNIIHFDLLIISIMKILYDEKKDKKEKKK